ncbi:MAG: tail fiber protein [Pseudomonadota bacterium]
MKRLLMTVAAAASLTAGIGAAPASAQEPFLGEVRILPYGFCPRGWTEADGKLLPVSQFDALFSLYGTTFGGDGRTTFGVPDFRGRSPMGIGSGPGLTTRQQGQKPGVETVTLTVAQMPSHNHRVQGTTSAPNTGTLNGNSWGNFATVGNDAYHSGGTLDLTARTDTIGMTGGSQSHPNIQPVLVLRHCLATIGTYPSRN